MSHLIENIEDIYNTYFQSPYKVIDNKTAMADVKYEQIESQWRKKSGSKNLLNVDFYKQYKNVEVFLPVTFYISESLSLEVYCCTVRITNKKTIVKTAVSERTGTVKEQFNVGDYVFDVKGVLYNGEGTFPDALIVTLKQIYESTQKVELHNALTDLFFANSGSRRIAIESLELPEAKRGETHVPFQLSCETDFIDTLILA